MPRRKITAAIDPKAAAELPALTDKQMHFVERILAGDTAADAYRAAYPGTNYAPHSLWTEATRAKNNPSIVLWLAAARKACLGSAVVTVTNHTQQLERLREIALDTGNVGAAVQAEQFRGKVAGLYVEQYRDLTPRDPAAVLREIAALNPRIAQVIAEECAIADARKPMPTLDLTASFQGTKQPVEQDDVRAEG